MVERSDPSALLLGNRKTVRDSPRADAHQEAGERPMACGPAPEHSEQEGGQQGGVHQREHQLQQVHDVVVALGHIRSHDRERDSAYGRQPGYFQVVRIRSALADIALVDIVGPDSIERSDVPSHAGVPGELSGRPLKGNCVLGGPSFDQRLLPLLAIHDLIDEVRLACLFPEDIPGMTDFLVAATGRMAVKHWSAKRDMRFAVAQLPDAQRDVIILRFASGLSVSDTAKALQKNENNVKVLQHKGMQRLQVLMAPKYPELTQRHA